MRKFLIIGSAIPVAAAATAVALATPGAGVLSAPVLARAAFGGDVMLQSKANQATGLTWRGREWSAGQLPEFLKGAPGPGQGRGSRGLGDGPSGRRVSVRPPGGAQGAGR